MDKKYELVKEDSIKFEGRSLFRIKALKDFQTIDGCVIKVGDLGGYIQSENNLSQEGKAWVSDIACVSDNAKVFDNAYVFNNACVCDNAKVFDNAYVFNNAFVCENACVYDNAYVYGNACVCSNAGVYGNACVFDNVWVFGNAKVGNNAYICNDSDYICIKGLGDIHLTITFYKCKDNQIGVSYDCFTGTLDDFVIVLKKGKDNKYKKEYLAAIEMVKIHFDLDKNTSATI